MCAFTLQRYILPVAYKKMTKVDFGSERIKGLIRRRNKSMQED